MLTNNLIEAYNEVVNLIVVDLEKLRQVIDGVVEIEERKKYCLSDIDKCMEYAGYYLNDPSLYAKNVFRYDSTIINFVDTVQFNDFGVQNPEFEKEKGEICRDLILKVEKIIALNLQLD